MNNQNNSNRFSKNHPESSPERPAPSTSIPPERPQYHDENYRRQQAESIKTYYEKFMLPLANSIKNNLPPQFDESAVTDHRLRTFKCGSCGAIYFYGEDRRFMNCCRTPKFFEIFHKK